MKEAMPAKALLFRQILQFLGCVIGGLVIGQLLALLIAQQMGVSDIQHLITELQEGRFLEHVMTIRIISIVTHLGMYAFAALAFAYLVKRRKAISYLKLNRVSALPTWLLTVLAAAAAYPIAMWIYYLNMQLIPSSWVAEDTLLLQERLMNMPSVNDLVVNLILLGLVAGIGEELVFRGIIQRFATQLTKNTDIAIFITAFLFSAIHFQPEGFIPRFMLGVLLGYLLKWTGNLWTPILAHVSFNGLQVVLYYLFMESMNEQAPDTIPEFSIAFTLAAVAVFSLAILGIWKFNQKHQLQLESYDSPE